MRYIFINSEYISPVVFLNYSTLIWEHTDMKLSGIYTMGVSLGQTKTLRIYILLKKSE